AEYTPPTETELGSCTGQDGTFTQPTGSCNTKLPQPGWYRGRAVGLGKKKETDSDKEKEVGLNENKEFFGKSAAVNPFRFGVFRSGIFGSLGDTRPIFPLLG